MGDIGMLKGGLLAWLLWQGGVVIDVVVLRGINVGLDIYRRRRGGRNSKFTAIMQTICRTCLKDMHRCSTA